MSVSGDDRVQQQILEMVFRNEQFEAGVSETLKSLQNLTTSTAEAVKAINSNVVEGFGKAVSKVDIAGLSDGINGVRSGIDTVRESVSNLEKAFSPFGEAARKIFRDITGEVEQLGKKMIDVFTSGPQEGWNRYDMYSNSVKTLLNSAKNADGARVTLEGVNEVLADLNEYADETIYSFADMTNNITKFTNAGVDLKSAATAMKGIANLAAVSGANANEASRAMYNFGQALGSGFVRYIDWKSILNANMATLDFKQALIDTGLEMKTLRKVGDQVVATTVESKKANEHAFTAAHAFDEALKDQWMTTEVLTATLAKYTNETTEFGQKAIIAAKQVNTFSKMIDIIKDALGSEWMKTMQIVIGDFNEQTELWTRVYTAIEKAISKVADFRNDTLKVWKDLGGRSDLIEAFANIWKIAEHYITPVYKSLYSLHEFLGGKLADGAKKFRDFTEHIKGALGIVDKAAETTKETVDTAKEIAEDLEEMARLVIRGDYGNGKARRDALEAEGKSYERIQNKVNELLGCSFRYEVEEEEVADAVEGTTEAAEEQVDVMTSMSKVMPVVTDNFGKFAGMIGAAWNLVVQAGDGILTYFISPIVKALPGALLAITNAVGTISGGIGSVLTRIHDMYWIPNILEAVATAAEMVMNTMHKAVKPIIDFVASVLELEELKTLGNAIFFAFDRLIVYITEIPQAIKGFIDNISSNLKKLSGVQALSARFAKVGESLKNGFLGAFKRVFEFATDVANSSPIGSLLSWLEHIYLWLDRVLSKNIEEGSFFQNLFSEGGLINRGAHALDRFLGLIDGGLSKIFEFVDKLFKPKTDADHSTLGVMASGLNLLEKIKLPKAVEDFLALDWAEKIMTVGNAIVDFFIGLGKGVINLVSQFPQLQCFEDFVGLITAFAQIIRNRFGELVHSAFEAISDFLDSHLYQNPSFEWIFGENGLINNAVKFVTNFIDKAKKLPQMIKNMDIFGQIMERITGSEIYQRCQQLVEYFQNLFYTITHPGEIEVVQNFINTITTFFESMKQKGFGVIEKIQDYIQKAKNLPETVKNMGLLDKIMEKVSNNPIFKTAQSAGRKVVKFFKDLAKRVKEFVTSDAFSKFAESFIGFFVMLGEGIVAVSGKVIEFFTWLSTIPGKLKEFGIFDKLAATFQKIYGIGQSVIGFFVTLFEKVSKLGELEGVQKFTSTLTEFFSFIKETALDVLGQLLDKLDSVFGSNMFTDDGFVNFFGEGGIVDTAMDLLSRFLEEMEKAPEVFRKFGNFFTGTGEGTLIGGITGKFPALQNVFDRAQQFFTGVGQTLENSLPDIGLSGISSMGKTSALGAFTGILTGSFKLPKISDIIKHATADISDGLDQVAESTYGVSTASQSVGQAGGGLDEWLQKLYPLIEEHVIPALGDIIDKMGDKSLNDWLGNLANLGVVRIIFKIGDGFKNVAKGLGNFSDAMAEMKQGFTSFKNMWVAFEGVPTSLKNMFKDFGDLSKKAGTFLDAFRNMDNLKKIFKEWRKKPLTTALRDFAIAIALVAASFWLLGKVDYKAIEEGSGVLIAFIGVITAFWTTAAMLPETKLTAMAQSFAGLGIGLLALVGAVAILGLLDWEILGKGGLAVVVLMMALAKAAQIAAGSGPMAVFGFLAMALAVDLLVPAVYLLGKIKPWTDLAQGGAAVVALMMFMALAAKIASGTGKTAVFSFLAIALAIDLLVPAVYLLGTMDQATLIQGGAAVVAFMMFMALAVRIASKNSALASVSFVSMVIAVGLLVPIMLAISFIPAERVIGGGAAIVALMLALAYAVRVAGTAKGNTMGAILAMSALVGIVGMILIELARYDVSKVLGIAVSLGVVFMTLGFAFKMLDDNNWDDALVSMGLMLLCVTAIAGIIAGLLYFTNGEAGKVLTVAISLSALMLALSAAMRIASGIDPVAAAKGAGAIDAFVFIIGAFGALVAAIDYFTGGKDGKMSAIDRVIEGCNKIGLMFYALAQGFQGNSFSVEDAKSDAKNLDEAGGSLSSFAEKITNFLEMLNGVDESKAEAAKNLGDAIWQITKAEVLDGLASLLGIQGDFGTFGATLTAYAESLFNFVDAVNAHETVADNEKLAAVEAATERWMAIAERIKPNKGLIPLIAGITDIGKFGEQMKIFAEQFYVFMGEIEAMTIGEPEVLKMALMELGTGYMLNIAERLKPNEGLIPSIVGISDIGKFGVQMGQFAAGFGRFNWYARTIDKVVEPEKVQAIADATVPMLELAKLVEPNKGILSWFASDRDLGSFGTKLGDFADGVKTFYAKLLEAGIDTVYLYSITTSLKRIGELGNVDTSGMDSFTEDVNTLGDSISHYFGSEALVSAENIDQFVTSLEKIRDFAATLSVDHSLAFDAFVESIKNAASMSVQGFLDKFLNAASDGTAADTVDAFLAAAESPLAETVEGFTEAGTASATNYIQAFEETSYTAEAMMRLYVSGLIAILAVYYTAFNEAGQTSGDNYGRGIKSKEADVKIKAGELVQAAIDGLDKEGTYKKFKEVGSYAGEGIYDGLNSWLKSIKEKAASIASEAYFAAKNALGEASPSKKMYEVGEYAGIGMLNGLNATAEDIEDASYSIADGSLAAAMAGVSDIARMINEDLDAEPTIRPVIDTSGIQYGIGLTNDMLTAFNDSPVVRAALDISSLQNEAAMNIRLQQNANYTNDLRNLVNNTKLLIEVAKQNRSLSIDGDYLYGYVNTRLGAAY